MRNVPGTFVRYVPGMFVRNVPGTFVRSVPGAVNENIFRSIPGGYLECSFNKMRNVSNIYMIVVLSWETSIVHYIVN